MPRKNLLALLALPLCLATAAHAEETSVRGTQRPDIIDARTGGKLVLDCTGRAQDILVIRLGDGSVWAAGTLAQLKMGVARGIGQGGLEVADPNAYAQRALPQNATIGTEDKVAGPTGPQTTAEAPKTDSGGKTGDTGVWNEAIEVVDLRITIPAVPSAFGRGSVTLYRGAAVMDTDRINLR